MSDGTRGEAHSGTATMRAVLQDRYGPPEVLRLGTLPVPAPAPGQVRIRVRAVEVTKTDCELRSFHLPVWWYWLPLRMAVGLRRPKRRVLGMYFAGEVDACGSGARRFAPGDAVFGCTSFRASACGEFLCLPEQASLAALPKGCTFESAAASLLGGLNAQHFVDVARIRAGERVLVIGAGGSIGLAAVQLARARGARVDVVDAPHKRAMLEALGIDRFWDYTLTDASRSGERWDVIVSMVAPTPYGRALKALNPDGRYCIAVPRYADLMRAPFISGGKRRKVIVAMAREGQAELARLTGHLESGDLDPVIDSVRPLDDVVEAHRLVEQERRCGSVVLRLDDGDAAT